MFRDGIAQKDHIQKMFVLFNAVVFGRVECQQGLIQQFEVHFDRSIPPNPSVRFVSIQRNSWLSWI